MIGERFSELTSDSEQVTNSSEIASTPLENQSKHRSVPRRGFLKQMATVGTIGMAGIATQTEKASAASYSFSVDGNTQDSWSNYQIEYSGDVYRGGNTEGGDLIEGDVVTGTTFGEGRDTYTYNGELHNVYVNGAASVFINGPTWQGEISAYGLDGWSDYVVRCEEGIALDADTAEDGQDVDGGKYISGSIFADGSDVMFTGGSVDEVHIRGNAYVFFY